MQVDTLLINEIATRARTRVNLRGVLDNCNYPRHADASACGSRGVGEGANTYTFPISDTTGPSAPKTKKEKKKIIRNQSCMMASDGDVDLGVS